MKDERRYEALERLALHAGTPLNVTSAIGQLLHAAEREDAPALEVEEDKRDECR